jgi:hypothetical protein
MSVGENTPDMRRAERNRELESAIDTWFGDICDEGDEKKEVCY